MVCHGKYSKFLSGNLIDDAIRESAEDIVSTSATKHSADQRIGQNEIGCSFKLGYKCATKLDIRF